ALFGEETLRVILHAFQRPGLVADAHDLVLIGPTADLVIARHSALLDDQTVISRGGEGVGHACVDGAAVVVDLIGLAVHQTFGADDLGAADEADALVAQTHAKRRQ